MRRVKISELKAHLSEYLREVGSGNTIVVCDRDRPVARLSPAPRDEHTLRLRPPRQKTDLRLIEGVEPMRSVDIVAALREDRDRR